MIRLLLIGLLTAPLWSAQVTYKVRLTRPEGNLIVQLKAEEYVAAVVAGESSTFRSEKAMKAMAVAARTYAARFRGRHAADGFDFCATTHCQRAEFSSITDRVKLAAAETIGELVWYAGKPAFSVYTRDCGGKTEAVESLWPELQASYLTTHSDPYCLRAVPASWAWTARSEEIERALGRIAIASAETATRGCNGGSNGIW